MPKYWDMNLGPHLWSQTLYVQNPRLAILTSFRTFWQKFRPLKTKSNCWERPGCSSQLWTEAAETSVSVEASKSFIISLPCRCQGTYPRKLGSAWTCCRSSSCWRRHWCRHWPEVRCFSRMSTKRLDASSTGEMQIQVLLSFSLVIVLLNTHLLSLTGLKLHGKHILLENQ